MVLSRVSHFVSSWGFAEGSLATASISETSSEILRYTQNDNYKIGNLVGNSSTFLKLLKKIYSWVLTLVTLVSFDTLVARLLTLY